MQAIYTPDITTTNSEGNTASFEIAPLHRGFGVTLGNSLRRVLLSSLGGASVTAFRIEGASHEFTAIDGVREDAVQIMLNLKQLSFRVFSDEPQTLVLNKKGKGEVTAADIAETGDVEVTNPEQVIATLDDDKTQLKMEIRVEKGRGYVLVDDRSDHLPVGMIAVDALFSPVKKVRYKIGNTRVGQITDLDKLSVEIETDGSIDPRDALAQAATILSNQFSVIAGGDTVIEPAEEEPAEAAEDELNISIDELNLSSRTANALTKNEITTLSQLAKLSESELKGLQGFGNKAFEEVIAKLEELELK